MRDVVVRLAAVLSIAAFSGTAVLALTAPEVELVRPAAGAALVGGTTAVVEWVPEASPFGPRIQEWEAFLSFNDGDYYAVRITPHLDVSRRRFTFKVPDVATDRARILLRFGDEVEEVSADVDHAFSIRPGLASARRALRALSRGEAARPGEPGVVAWVEGSRQGHGLARFEVVPPRCTDATVSSGPAEQVSLLTRQSELTGLMPADGHARVKRAPPASEATDRPRPPAPILLLGCRQNE